MRAVNQLTESRSINDENQEHELDGTLGRLSFDIRFSDCIAENLKRLQKFSRSFRLPISTLTYFA